MQRSPLTTTFRSGVLLLALVGEPELAAGQGPSPAPPTAARAAGGQIHGTDGLEYVPIAPGSFLMGCVGHPDICEGDEKPRHPVTLTRPFWASRTEVTLGAFRRFVAATRYLTVYEKLKAEAAVTVRRSFSLDTVKAAGQESGVSWQYPGFRQPDDTHPVVGICWVDAAAFCKWSGGRLPTEAEWEYMARGGSRNDIYPWSGRDVKGRANYTRDRFEKGDDFDYTSPVGAFPPNNFGLHDLAGNAFEWTADWYGRTWYMSSPAVNPTGPPEGHFRVRRGGSWAARPEFMRSSARDWRMQDTSGNATGFRCVRDAPPVP